jgi:hypothetical protein
MPNRRVRIVNGLKDCFAEAFDELSRIGRAERFRTTEIAGRGWLNPGVSMNKVMWGLGRVKMLNQEGDTWNKGISPPPRRGGRAA